MNDQKDQRRFNRRHAVYLLAAGGVVGAAVLVSVVLPRLTAVSYSEVAGISAAVSTSTSASSSVVTTAEASSTAHVATPDVVKGIYMSQCVVGTPSFRDSLVKFIDTSDLNTVIIDVKDYTGKIAFSTDDLILHDSVSGACGAADMQAFVATLHQKNIYVIGRITVFQSPYYTRVHPEQAVQARGGGVWKDYKGLSYVDVGAKPYWDYIVELGKVSYAIGFDELNFDYMRFPSDGPMSQAEYTWDVGKTKPQALEEFYKYLTDQLRPTGAKLSVDLFGMTATNNDDLGIGQVLERALPYFDYVSPMVYPSHYPRGYNGYKDVNDHPYDIVNIAMTRAVERTTAATTTVEGLTETPIMQTVIVPAHGAIATTTEEKPSGVYTKAVYPASKIRPWLQSFDYPVSYTPAMVEAQIKATNDAGLQSYLVWDAANKYTSLRSVLAQ